MKRLTFRLQICIGLGIFCLCIALGQLLHNGIFHNLAWILYGLLFLLHPVWPQSWWAADEKKMRRGARLAGVIAIIIGIITRFGV